MAFAAAAVDQARATTYLVPAHAGARLPTLFVDAQAFDEPSESLHFKFLTTSFPELALLDYEAYLELTLDPIRREFFAGSITAFIEPAVYGITIWDRGVDPTATIECGQFKRVYDDVRARVTIGDVVVQPANNLQREVLAACPGVPTYDPSTALDYEAYTVAKGCGTVRRFTLAELPRAQFGWQDVLVTEEAPLDVDTIVAGIVTGTRQGELSHLNVRSASRGTPNCYVKDAYTLFEQHDGALVELECTGHDAFVTAISPEQAEQCWEAARPDPVTIVPADLSWTELEPLLSLSTQTVAERVTNVGRFGSKGAQPRHAVSAYRSGVAAGGLRHPALPLRRLRERARFRCAHRHALERPAVCERRRVAQKPSWPSSAPICASRGCDPALVSTIGDMIIATPRQRRCDGALSQQQQRRGCARVQRSRPLQFHERLSGRRNRRRRCPAEPLRSRQGQKSATSAARSKKSGRRCGTPKPTTSALGTASIIATSPMGVLVNTRTKLERANIVGFSGNPLVAGDDRYLINAQLGELAVVSSIPGVWPEKDLLSVDGGVVTDIERARGSTQLPEGQWVLSDGQLPTLGAALATISEVLPSRWRGVANRHGAARHRMEGAGRRSADRQAGAALRHGLTLRHGLKGKSSIGPAMQPLPSVLAAQALGSTGPCSYTYRR